MQKKSVRKIASNPLKKVIIVISLILLSIIILFCLLVGLKIYKTHQQQASLTSFYNTSNIPNDKPGKLIRYERMYDVTVPYGKAYRILYHSQRADGTPTISSGMIFIPDNPATTGNNSKPATIDRSPIVAWAHGTIGMGLPCAPSQSTDPLADIGGLSEMMQAGFIVTATDYAGLGTAGTEMYLIGDDEARDVLNSIRAAKQLYPNASNRFALWGHSAGGHSVLFAANLAKSYAPGLTLVAAAAGAPAAQLPELMQQQYKTGVSWFIGPEMAISWPLVYKDLNLQTSLSQAALQNYKRIAFECSVPGALEALLRNKIDQTFFVTDPNTIPSWSKALQNQTPHPVLATPLLIVQSLADTVVLPNTTALYAKKSCDADANITVTWLGGTVTHQQTAITAGPSVVSWLSDRFAGLPTESTCTQPLPIKPAKELIN